MAQETVKNDVKRYIVQQGYAYFKGDPKKGASPEGSVVFLTETEAANQQWKLAPIPEAKVICNACCFNFVTPNHNVDYVHCPKCGGVGASYAGLKEQFTPPPPLPGTENELENKAETGDGASDLADEGVEEKAEEEAAANRKDRAETETRKPKPKKAAKKK